MKVMLNSNVGEDVSVLPNWDDTEVVPYVIKDWGKFLSAKVVIGVGNLLLKDEGIGIHIIQALQKAPPKDVTIIDGGTSPDVFQLLPKEIDKLIVIDAVRGGCEPGSIYRFTPEDITFSSGIITSLHQLGLSEGLKLMEYTGIKPKEVVIIGIEPKEIDWGLEISLELQRKIPQVIDLVMKEIY